MIKYFYFLLFFIFFKSSAQILHHNMLSSQGNSIVTLKGVGVTQTIGQQSVAGTAKFNQHVVQQGFQQSLLSRDNLNLSDIDVVEKVYPNPFSSVINFEFSSEINGEIEVRLFDDLGRLIFSTKEISQQNHLTITPSVHLAEGHYVISLVSKNFKYSVQLIKSNSL